MKKHLPIIAIAVSAICWGIAIPSFKVAVHVPPFSYAEIRFTIAFLLLAPYALRKAQSIPFHDIPKIALAGFLGTSLNIAFLFVGLHYTSADEASLITNLSPIITIFAAAIFLREPLTRHHVFGAVMSLIGVVILIGNPLATTQHHLLGNGLIIIAAVAWAAFTIAAKSMSEKYSTTTLATYYFLIAIVSFLPLSIWEFLRLPNWPYTLQMQDLASLTYYAIFGSLVAYFLYAWGLARTNASAASTTQYLTPIVSIICAAILLGEHVSATMIIGGLCILAGVVYATSHAKFLPRFSKAQVSTIIQPDVRT